MTTMTTDDLSLTPGSFPSEPAENAPRKPAFLRLRKPPMGLLVAVEALCLECVGTDRRALDGTDRITHCRATGCPLRPVRPGQRTTRETLWPAIRAKCRRCQGADPGVELRIAHCEVSTCPLRPVREYREPGDA
ncbi:MAG: hypothetical protein JW940_02640 [Polyangiaceae bacterium]|nr:hypothetical protein [Polyangiaceae bacterium]